MAAGIGATPFPKGEPFSHLPTLEDLQQRSGLKIAALRVRLAAVKRHKCPDNTVRYDDQEAAAALEGGPDPVLDELDDAGAAEPPLSADPFHAAMQVVNRTMAQLVVVVRQQGEIVRHANDTIRTMGEPLKLGQELVREGVAVMRDRLKHYDEMWDGMILLVEDLQSTRDVRARAAAQQVERSEFRRETFSLAKKYVPDALNKFQLTLEAQLALDLLRGLDPEMLGPIVEHAVPAEMQPKARKLVELLAQRRRATVTTQGAPKAEPPKEGDNASKQDAAAPAATPG